MDCEGPFARLAKSKTNSSSSCDDALGNGKGSTLASSTSAQPPVLSAGRPSVRRDFDYPVEVNNLTFAYPGVDGRPIPGIPPVVKDMNMKLPPSSRVLLVGPNGAGKTTLLKTLAGKHMVPETMIRVLGSSAFHDTSLTTSGDLSYVGGNWTRDVAFAGLSVPLAGDFPARRLLDSIPGVDLERKEKLIRVLDVNPEWRMHMVSDGQRRRVQIAAGLLTPFKVLLLDEITVDLDVLGRAELMSFLKDECECRGAVCIYATHIFDGLESWPTHIAYVAGGQLRTFEAADRIPELQEGKLLELVVSWLKEEKLERKRREADSKSAKKTDSASAGYRYVLNNGYGSGTLNPTAQLPHSSNAVFRN
uniref:CCR4-NOT complex subunit CAF16 n=1 Tax=Tetraselmis sp. GSL018 TaxID=582737 RepID=A0A061RZU5_9CHLO